MLRPRFLACLTLWCASLGMPVQADEPPAPQAVDVSTLLSIDRLVEQLQLKRLVFIGESHDRYDHHLNQLEIIRRLHQLDPELAVGVEHFQQPFQSHVDAYIAGKIDEREFLKHTEYYERWRFDYRLYAPLFRFLREKRIPVVALNVPTDVTRSISKSGLEAVTDEQRKFLPSEIDRSDEAYAARLRKVFEDHSSSGRSGSFERFLDVQLVWDEGMAQAAATYLRQHPSKRLVILAGAGHLEYGSGIPNRLKRRTGLDYAVVLNEAEPIQLKIADFVLFSKEKELPASGVLGVMLEEDKGSARIGSLTAGGAGEKAGLKRGDVIASVDGHSVKRISDLRVALWDKVPGDRVTIGIRRGPRFGSAITRELDIQLEAPAKPAGHP